MLGRAEETSRIAAVVRDAGSGRSGALLVVGEPGIGKTVLLGHARSLAEAEDALVLEASGAEGEAHLAFAGLSDLLRPALGHLDAVPGPQADALRGALALGPPQPGDRFTTYAATLSLLAAAAEHRPVACIIDDAHWLDAESFEAVQFASRRLGAEGVAVLMAARDGLSERVDAWPLDRLRLAGLSGDEARALIAEHARAVPSPQVLDALVGGAKGNPLALIELAGSLSPDQLAGAEPLPDPLPVGPYLRDALLRPVRALPETTRRALLVVSAGDGTTGFLPAALAAEGLSMADLEPAERVGVLVVSPSRALFSHPLVRAAVYRQADAIGRRAAHRAHAASAAAVGEGALDRRAWHLALAATGPDEDAAAELEAAGGRAAARNGHAAACQAYETAARLSPVARERGRRTLAAARSALAAGDFTRGGRLFDEVAALDADTGQVIDALVGRGHVETFGGSAVRAAELLAAAADRVEPASPAAAAALLIQATIPAVMQTDLAQAIRLSERAEALAHDAAPPIAALAEVAGAVVATFAASPREARPEALAQLAQNVAAGDPVSAVWLNGSLQGLMIMERYDEAIAGLDEVIRAARGRSTPSVLLLPLFTRAEIRRRTGRLDLAVADAAEAVRLGRETGQETAAAICLFPLAAIDAIRGRSRECRARAAEMVALAQRSDHDFMLVMVDHALGLHALGVGDLEEALDRLRAAERRRNRGRGFHHPLMDAYEQDLAETLARLGRGHEADEVVTALEEMARRSGTLWPAAAVARCRGLRAGDDFEDHFAESLSLFSKTTLPFERARTELCLGERRRRARRARDARAPLSAALATFDELGAEPWAAWARRELRAAGGRVRGARTAGTGQLTPQELQVALAVAEGATNKEAAGALLISPKTVEYHLAKVYEKLGVRSRAELAGRMAREDVPLAETGAPD